MLSLTHAAQEHPQVAISDDWVREVPRSRASGELCVIPARGGSKRIPRKNIRRFCGKPMIAHSIEAAMASGCFERVVVSTDDDEIACVAEAFGAEVPFRRAATLADDHATTGAVVADAIHQLRAQGACHERVCCVYATAPLLEPSDLRRGLGMLLEGAAQYVFSVTTFDFPVQRALRLAAGGGVMPLQPECAAMRSQDLETIVHDAGQFYWGRADAFLAGLPVFAPHSRPLLLPRWRVQDIDTEEDWLRAELMATALRSRG